MQSGTYAFHAPCFVKKGSQFATQVGGLGRGMVGTGMREESGTKRDRALFMGKWGKWQKMAQAMTVMKRDTKWTDRLNAFLNPPRCQTNVQPGAAFLAQ